MYTVTYWRLASDWFLIRFGTLKLLATTVESTSIQKNLTKFKLSKQVMASLFWTYNQDFNSLRIQEIPYWGEWLSISITRLNIFILVSIFNEVSVPHYSDQVFKTLIGCFWNQGKSCIDFNTINSVILCFWRLIFLSAT